MLSFDSAGHFTKQHRIESLIAKIKLVESKTDIREERIFHVYYQIGELFNDYPHTQSSFLTSTAPRIYSTEIQEKIIQELQEIRKALVLKKFDEISIQAFDMAQDKWLEFYCFNNYPKKPVIKSKELGQEKQTSPVDLKSGVIQPLWHEEGDFLYHSRIIIDTEVTPIRDATYTCQASNKIQMIKIYGYQDDDIHFVLGINKSNYQEVLAHLKKQGFPKIDFLLSRHSSTYNGNYRTVVQSPEFLDNFLKVLIQIEPSVQAISNTIYGNTQSYLKTKITIPGWIRSHSFCLINIKNTRPLKRALYYQAIQPTKIKQLDILGYADNHVDLNIAMNTDGYLDFLKLFSVKGNFRDLTSSGSNTSIKIRDSEHLITLLEILRKIDPSISPLLIADILNRYDPNYVPSRQHAFLMGYHSERVGEISPISFLTKIDLRGDPKIARDIFSFLFYSPAKRKQTTQPSDESYIEKLGSGDHSTLEKENPSNFSMP